MGKGAQARAERTRDAIVAAAAEQFLDKGFLGASMDEIAAVAGVSKQTVYAHFASKEALFLAMVEELTGGAADALRDRLADPDGTQPVGSFLLDFAVQQLTVLMTPRLMRLRRLAIGEVARFPQLAAALHERGPSSSIRRLERAFTLYGGEGALNVPDPRRAAWYCLWLITGGPVNDVMLLGDGAILDRSAIERHAAEAVRIFLAAHEAGAGALSPEG